MVRCLKILVVCGLATATGIWLLSRVPRATPVRDGNSHDFWHNACWVTLGSEHSDATGGVYPPRDGWFIYYIQGWHQEFIYRVPEPAAMADFPAVVKALETRCQGSPKGFVEKGYLAWRRAEGRDDDAAGLLAALRAARHEELQARDADLVDYALAREADFDNRWERAKRYWLTMLFEFTLLAGLIVLAAIPWLCNAGRLTWSICLALVPPLLFLPWYLGYVPLVFTSAWPAGGIVYPEVVIHFSGLPWTALDTWLFEHVPKLCEPFSQPIGGWLAQTGMGAVGPVAATVMGLLVGVATFAAGTALRCIRRTAARRKRAA